VFARSAARSGAGEFQGNGYHWWWYTILSHIDHRPHLINTKRCVDTLIQGIRMFNSPQVPATAATTPPRAAPFHVAPRQYHLLLEDTLNLIVRKIHIQVDVNE
jgi:hypothetical protein